MCLLKECVKFIVLAFNLIFVLVGIALITVGTIYKINLNDVTKAIPEPYSHLELVPILTIVIGSIIFVISFLGCCGAVRNSPCLLTTYAVILLVIFVLQIALGVFAFLEVNNKEDFEKSINKTVDDIFHKNNTESELINFMQEELKCCGTFGPKFWSDTMNETIPPTCYKEKKTGSPVYTEGCQKNFYDFLLKIANIIGITVLALAATEVIGATFSLCLANSVRNDMRRSDYY